MKIKFNSDDHLLPLDKTLELYNMIIVVRSLFHEGNECYTQVFFRGINYKRQNLIELMFLKELMLTKPMVCSR